MQTYPFRNNPSLAHRKTGPIWTQSPLADFHSATCPNQKSLRLETLRLFKIYGIIMVKIVKSVKKVSRLKLEGRRRRRLMSWNEVVSPYLPSRADLTIEPQSFEVASL